MIVLTLLLTIIALVSSAIAISLPAKIQMILSINEEKSAHEFLDSCGVLGRVYLIVSMAPIALILLLPFSGTERGLLYSGILLGLCIISIVFRSLFSSYKRAIVIESTLELIIYCDIVRNCYSALLG